MEDPAQQVYEDNIYVGEDELSPVLPLSDGLCQNVKNLLGEILEFSIAVGDESGRQYSSVCKRLSSQDLNNENWPENV